MWATFAMIAFALYVMGKSEASGAFVGLSILAFLGGMVLAFF
jgi:hypothetical protein